MAQQWAFNGPSWRHELFARVEDRGCPRPRGASLLPDTYTAFADEGDRTGRYGRQVLGASLITCYLTDDWNGGQ
jgi:hypothetical protein